MPAELIVNVNYANDVNERQCPTGFPTLARRVPTAIFPQSCGSATNVAKPSVRERQEKSQS